jgi:protein-arginine deiminase
MCLRCQKFYCAKHYSEQVGQCIPADAHHRRRLLAARETRREHEASLPPTLRTGLVAPCQRKQLDIIVTDAVTGAGIADARVALRPRDVLPASVDGSTYHFADLPDGMIYTVLVVAPEAYGEVVQRGTATAGRDATVQFQFTPFSLALALDANRDGMADAAGGDFATWTSGAQSSGAVVFFNNLNTGRQFAGTPGESLPIVNAHDETMAAAEPPYLAPLDLVITRPCTPDYSATLSAEPAGKLRIFCGGQAVLGPAAARWAVPLQPAGTLHCLIEGTGYPEGDFDGKVGLTLTLRNGDRVVRAISATVRISPWIMHNALDEVEHVFAVDIGNVKGMHAASRISVQYYLDDLAAVLGNRLIPVDFNLYVLTKFGQPSADLFIRDVMVHGSTSLPCANGVQHVPVVLGPMHDREASNLHHVALGLSGPQVGFHLPGGKLVRTDETCNYFGNFLCSPPVQDAPLGRIFYGTNTMYNLDAKLFAFLGAQCQPLCALDVSWLEIRHVDEVLCFVPAPSAHGFAVVMPSAAMALALLRQAHEVDNKATVFTALFQSDPKLLEAAGYDEAPAVASLLKDEILVSLQEAVELKLVALAGQVAAVLGIDPQQIIRLPVLFKPSEDALLPNVGAYTPNVANMLVATRADGHADLCIARPYGPLLRGQCIFEAAIATALLPTDNTIRWVRNFNMYHSAGGEVHCATNTVRIPRVQAGWWSLDHGDRFG